MLLDLKSKTLKWWKYILFFLFFICNYENGNMDAILVHLHSWYLQSIHRRDIITWTARTSARSTGTRMTGQVLIVPSTSTVPGGTGPAVASIPMGCISHLAQQMMAGPCIITPFVAMRAYAQWNSCSDKYVRIIIIILTWYLFRFCITSLKLFYMKTQ